MTTQQLQARYLYFNENKTQKEIAAAVGVTDRTLYNWIRQYAWHQQREATNSTMALIADNIGNQLLSFQRSIERHNEEGDCTPTPEEIVLQNKLISGLVSMKKYPRKGQVTEYMESFLHFADEQNRQIGDILFDLFVQYTGKQATTPRNRKEKDLEKPENAPEKNAETLTDKAIAPVSALLLQPEKSGNKTESGKPSTEEARITPADFEEYGYLIGSRHLRDVTYDYGIKFKGRVEDKIWLEYTLFQYCLPPAERRFINDIEELDREMPREKMYAQIDAYLKSNGRARMAA